MPSLKKQDLKKAYLSLLEGEPDIAFTTYLGLSVDEITSLREKLQEKGAHLKVVKNNIFKLALKEKLNSVDERFYKDFQGPIGVIFTQEGLPGAAKVLRDYGKENESVGIICGFMGSSYHAKKELEEIADLPSKEALLTSLVHSINSPASKVASALSQVIASLARGIQAVAEKNHAKNG